MSYHRKVTPISPEAAAINQDPAIQALRRKVSHLEELLESLDEYGFTIEYDEKGEEVRATRGDQPVPKDEPPSE